MNKIIDKINPSKKCRKQIAQLLETKPENEMSTGFHEPLSTIRQLTTNPSSQKYIFGTILSRQSYVLAKEIY